MPCNYSAVCSKLRMDLAMLDTTIRRLVKTVIPNLFQSSLTTKMSGIRSRCQLPETLLVICIIRSRLHFAQEYMCLVYTLLVDLTHTRWRWKFGVTLNLLDPLTSVLSGRFSAISWRNCQNLTKLSLKAIHNIWVNNKLRIAMTSE